MKSCFLICLVSLSLQAGAPCKDPFAANPTSFTLKSPLYCGPQEHYRYNLESTHAYLDTACIDDTKAMNLYDGVIDQGGFQDYIVLYSNPVTGSRWGTQTITAACTGQVQFGIQMTSANLQDLVTSYTVFDQTSETIAYVTASEDQASQVILRSAQNHTILANATRALLPNSNPTCARTQWTVSNPSTLSGAVMAYLLALKDNSNYACPAGSQPSLASSGSTGVIVAVVLGTGALVTGTLVAAARYYRKHYLKHDLAQHMRELE